MEWDTSWSPRLPASSWRLVKLWSRLGLRSRITALFGLGALVLSMSMGGLSYFTARHFLLNERHNTSVQQAYVNASLIRTYLHSGSSKVNALGSLASGFGSHSVLFDHGKWYPGSISIGQSAIPRGLRDLVISGTPATQNITLDGSPQIVVGIPVPSIGAAYFEFFDVSDLAHTLQVLSTTLLAAGLVTTLLGAAVGRSASGRSLKPLSDVSHAAVAIAGGDLKTRLPVASGDPDLAGLTRSFNYMVDQLSERIEREARFTSDVSHELRSPLTTLSASLDVLESTKDQLSPRSARALALLSADLHRFQRMVGDLLEISRSDSGSADVWLEEVRAGELVRRSVEVGARTLPKGTSPPQVKVDPALESAQLMVDKRRFERVIANLLENAALYAGGATTLRVAPGRFTRGPGTCVTISVEDNGPGISRPERGKVFERFYRGQIAGQRGTGTGTGLGLALVAEHVRLLNGSVWVDEAPGGGARFNIELPISESSEWN